MEEFRRRIAAFSAAGQRDHLDPGLGSRLLEAIRANGGLFDADLRNRLDPPGEDGGEE